MKRKFFTTFAFACLSVLSEAQIIESFDKIPLDSNSVLIGSSVSDTIFKNNLLTLLSDFDNTYGYWSGGFALSNIKDSATAGYSNLFGCKGYSGYKNSPNFLVVQDNAKLIINKNNYGWHKNELLGFYINNSTYAYKSMLYGDAFAKKFGGVTGNDPDFFVLTIKGYQNGVELSDSVTFYLADYRFSNNAFDYIVKDWSFINLTSLKDADEFHFKLNSSDVGQYGMNTPAFFCLDQFIFKSYADSTLPGASFFDDLLTVQDSVIDNFSSGNFFTHGVEFDNNYNSGWNFMASGFAVSTLTDSITPGYTNMYSSKSGRGYKSMAYGVVYDTGKIKSQTGLTGFYINNNTYAYYSMLNGDAFGKKFGGVDGNDPDWFKIIITRKGNNQNPDKTMEFYLADYRFTNNEQDYIIKDWTWVDLSPLKFSGEESGNSIDGEYEITFAGSDTGAFGLNTPKYACFDGLVLNDFPLATKQTVSSLDLQNLVLYPNPTTDFISFDNIEKMDKVQVMDLSGRALNTTIKYEKFIDVRNLVAGNYMVKAHRGKAVFVGKFVKD